MCATVLGDADSGVPHSMQAFAVALSPWGHKRGYYPSLRSGVASFETSRFGTAIFPQLGTTKASLRPDLVQRLASVTEQDARQKQNMQSR